MSRTSRTMRHSSLTVAAAKLYLFLAAALLFAQCAEHLAYLGEAGYGDAFAIRAIRAFNLSHEMYPDFHRPEHFADIRVYGPVYYLTLHAGSALGTPEGTDLTAARITVLLSFLACAFVSGTLLRRILPLPGSLPLGILCALAFSEFRPWVVQLRGDFLAAFLSLSAVALLLRHHRHPIAACALAGIVAGVAPAVKLSYISAIVAGTLWFLFWRDWRRALIFPASALLSASAVHLAAFARAPLLPEHYATLLTKPVTDRIGQLKLVANAVADPLVLLGFIGIALLCRRRWSRPLSLLATYSAVSFVIALRSAAHQGGNINYFFEFYFAIVPFALFALLQSLRFLERGPLPTPPRRKFLVAAFLIALSVWALPPLAGGMLHALRAYPRVALRNHRYTQLQKLQKHTVLSFVPDATLATGATSFSDPWAVSYFSASGVLDLRPRAEQVSARHFEVVIQDYEGAGWRGQPAVPASLRAPLQENYAYFCEFVHLRISLPVRPITPQDQDVRSLLQEMGCR